MAKNNRQDENSRVVYSTQFGRMCPTCGHPINACMCSKKVAPQGGDGIVRVRRESKGRGGKTVTVIAGLPLASDELKQLAQDLKKKCGTGGTAKDGVIEIQGDHTDKIVTELASRGFKTKRAGG